jgi:hypothetical protein
MFTKPPFTCFEITLIQIHFAKKTLGFSVITKLPFLFALLSFQKLHTNTHKLYTNKHIFHTNKLYLVLQVHELSQLLPPTPLKKASPGHNPLLYLYCNLYLFIPIYALSS